MGAKGEEKEEEEGAAEGDDIEEAFVRYDTDGDGVLNLDEFKKMKMAEKK